MVRHLACIMLTLMVLCTLPGIRSTPADTQPPGTPRFTGAHISLDVQQAEITDVLRLIAEVSQLNLITSPEVQGKVTTRMMDVPWDQALDVILKLYSLGMERYGNVVLIAPLQQLVAQRQGHLRRQQAEDQAEAVVTRIIPVHYARAENLQPHVERFLGDCARVAIDRRTNSLILTGTPACLRLGTHRAP